MLPPASPAVKRRTEPRDVENYRTCCDCCHIKVGTVFLGLLEAMISLGLLFTLTQKIVWKTRQSALCNKSLLADCIFYQFVHYNVTLIYDYIIVILLSLVLFSILLMFCGIMSETSSMLLPHLFIQAAFLLFSIGYFLLYAWTYFYGDLYTHNRKFTVQVLMERMWFSTLLMLIAACQVYLFFAVAKCTIYLAKMEECRRQRESAFWRTSERVRIAKENGLWRNNGVGGFMQYTTQYDPEANTKKKTPKEGRVQWNMEPKVVVLTEEEEEEKSRAEAARLAKAASSSCAPSTSQAERQGIAEAAAHKHHHHHHHSQSTKRSSKESVQRSSSGGSGSGGSPTRKPHEHHRREEAEDGAKQKRHSHSKRTVAHTDSNEKKERTATSKDRGGNSKPSPEKIKGHRGSIGSSSGMRRSSSGGTTGGTPVETTSQKASSRRSSRPLRKLKSVDSADQLALSEEVQETRTRSRRRSSDAGVASSIQNPCKADLNNSPRRHHRREESNRSAATSTPNSSSADRRPHDSSIFKKVSITTTITPLA